MEWDFYGLLQRLVRNEPQKDIRGDLVKEIGQMVLAIAKPGWGWGELEPVELYMEIVSQLSKNPRDSPLTRPMRVFLVELCEMAVERDDDMNLVDVIGRTEFWELTDVKMFLLILTSIVNSPIDQSSLDSLLLTYIYEGSEDKVTHLLNTESLRNLMNDSEWSRRFLSHLDEFRSGVSSEVGTAVQDLIEKLSPSKYKTRSKYP
jgi:hypothetical protein